MNNAEIKPSARGDLAGESALARLAEATAAAFARVPAGELRTASRGRVQVARARQTAMYLAHVVFGLSFTRVGICFGRDRTTVRHACALIEDRRDDPGLDLGLTAIEAGLNALRGVLLATNEREVRS